jgi:prevent-host-death family protein
MKEIAISEFKAKCLALLEQVRKTKQPIQITRFGEPVAQIVPPTPREAAPNWLGSMADRMDLAGDIIAPVIEIGDVEALGD